MADDQPMWDAMATAAWLLAATERLTVGHLVLCDAFRHPAVLSREAVTLDHASGGRFELGIGAGSVPTEFGLYGITPRSAGDRVTRLGETLDVLKGLWSGEPFDYHGTFHHIHHGHQLPVPTAPVPIVIGAAGPRMMQLVAQHATWWNLPIHEVRRLDERRPLAGSARVSVQQMVTYIPSETQRADVEGKAAARFADMGRGRLSGTGPELVDQLQSLAARGVERTYAWFTDFADVATLDGFGRDVIPHLT